jgi:hypothetical protein
LAAPLGGHPPPQRRPRGRADLPPVADRRALSLAPGRRARTRLAGLFLFLPLLASPPEQATEDGPLTIEGLVFQALGEGEHLLQVASPGPPSLVIVNDFGLGDDGEPLLEVKVIDPASEDNISLEASWEEGPTITQARGENGAFARFAFARGGNLLALAAGVGRVRLVNPDTGEAVASLSVPEQTVVQPAAFSADGSELTALGSSNHVMYTWDLRAIRAGLRDLGLDWEAPDYPPPAPTQPPLRLEVVAPGPRPARRW